MGLPVEVEGPPRIGDRSEKAPAKRYSVNKLLLKIESEFNDFISHQVDYPAQNSLLKSLGRLLSFVCNLISTFVSRRRQIICS